ncbi:MAG: alpha-ketoacid dehydrogenase subunit beta [Peptococcaceae bacterium]|nr:alpha-ketoacid dehydrogenase subunit beta [Peptococcaceae bacterium]
MSKKTYATAIRDTIAEEMRRDDRVFIMGEDVETLGGVFGCTRDLYKEFGVERVRNTPISEAGIVGAGVGAACAGMRPIVELMYMDFTLVSADQILNQAAKTRYVFGGKARIPLVIRGQQGIGRGNAATHSQSLETLFMHVPGLKVACPSTAADAAGLLRTAIRDDNPVMFFEHKALYSVSFDVPDDTEYMIPFGKAHVKRAGKDVTIVASLLYVSRALEAAEDLAKQGIEAEVIDPRTLIPLDMDTIVESVKKTGRLVIAHEAHRMAGWGAEVAAQATESAFRYLDAAPIRLGAKACPIPFNLELESAVVPSIKDIIDAAKAVCYHQEG